MDNREYVWQPDYCKGQRLAEIQVQEEGDERSLSVQNENIARRKRTKLGHSIATGNHPNDDGHHHVNKGKGKDVAFELKVLHVFDEQQEMSVKGKRVRGVAAGNELQGIRCENVAAVDDDEVQVLHFSDQRQKMSDNQGKGKQVEEDALHGGEDDDDEDDCVMIDAEKFRKAIERNFAPVDKNYGDESENDFFASLEMIENLNGFEDEQDEPDANKTNVKKGKEAIIVDVTEAEKEPVTGEEKTEKERMARRAKEKGKGISQMADSEEEGERGKTNEEQDQQEGKSNNTSRVKKPRLVWTPQLYYNFIAAVQALGDDSN